MFYGSKLAAMPPKLRSNDGKHVVIRPLAYVPEKYTARYAKLKEFPIIPCTLCGSQESLKRKIIEQMLRQWDQLEPKRLNNIMRALQNVNPSHLADRDLFDFESLVGAFVPEGESDPLASIDGAPQGFDARSEAQGFS